MLIIFGGLPGTGKSTIAKKLAEKLQACYLRIDTIEQALRDARCDKDVAKDMGPEGYIVAYALARDNISIGLTVIADSVNPITITRNDWRNVSLDLDKPFIEIEVICSNAKEHERRVEERRLAFPNQYQPTWQDVLDRDYEPWQTKNLTIDTSIETIQAAVDKIIELINSM